MYYFNGHTKPYLVRFPGRNKLWMDGWMDYSVEPKRKNNFH